MKAKHIKVGAKIVSKKTDKAKYNKPDVSTIDSISPLGTIHLDNDVFGYTPDYLCLNYKLYKVSKMKRSEVKVGVLVKHTDSGAYSGGQVGVLLDTESPLLWVRFDDDAYNNTDLSQYFGVGVRGTACHYQSLEVVKDET